MKLFHVATEFVALKQSMGMVYRAEAVTMRAFCKFMGDIDIAAVNPESIRAFLAGKGPITLFWYRKYSLLKVFYRFAISRGYVSTSPLPTSIPKPPKAFQAYIYTTEELRRLIDAIPQIRAKKSRLRAETFRILLLLLYGTGLRLGEALSLTFTDVDLSANLLTVRNTKFFKTRLVPIGPQLAAEMLAYARKRRQTLPCPFGENSAFIAPRAGTSMVLHTAEGTFRELCQKAGISRNDGASYQPRLHDLRHTFAVHRLVNWYQDGADVQRLLPLLSIYMGHVHLSSTQYYLTMTPELLRQASQRFERYAITEVNHV